MTPIAGLFSHVVIKPFLKPVVRIISGVLAIPLFRFLLRRVLRIHTSDAELERDLELWFRGSIVLLAATANLEDALFGWIPWQQSEDPWLIMLLRLLLAIGVIEAMPDQELFSLLHHGPPGLQLGRGALRRIWEQRRDWIRGLFVLHLKRSSPVLVIMAVVFGGPAGTIDRAVGWWCYGFAILQYLIIALVTDRDRAAGIMVTFDREVEVMRQELLRDAAGRSACWPGSSPPRGLRHD